MIFANAGGVSAYAGALAEKKQTNIGVLSQKIFNTAKMVI